MGRPKALLRGAGGESMLVGAVERLLAGGCEEVVVVLGAEADRAEELLTDAVGRWAPGVLRAVVAADWDRGMAASLAAGLTGLAEPAGPAPDAVVVQLVDLPDVGTAVVSRVVEAWRGAGADPAAILRAAYDGDPGHPVLLGHDHVVGLAAEVAEALRAAGPADYGARHYLADRQVQLVECGDLASGHDVDRPEDLL
jgi:CTP:molybdopterin cytidylyltransferase MocA